MPAKRFCATSTVRLGRRDTNGNHGFCHRRVGERRGECLLGYENLLYQFDGRSLPGSRRRRRALAEALGMDPRIGKSFLNAGIGYGGGCLPKDVRGLAAFADQTGVRKTSELLMVVDGFNTARRADVVRMVGEAAAGGTTTTQSHARKRIAVWGAAFKPGIDDVRDSPSLDIACRLHDLGARVTVYDPVAMGNALEVAPQLTYADLALEAARDADAILVATAWPEFAGISPFATKAVGASMTVVDACQGIDNSSWRKAGWKVLSLTNKLAEASPPPSSHSGRLGLGGLPRRSPPPRPRGDRQSNPKIPTIEEYIPAIQLFKGNLRDLASLIGGKSSEVCERAC